MNTYGHDPYNTSPVRHADPAKPEPSREQLREAAEILKCYETVLTLARAARSVS